MSSSLSRNSPFNNGGLNTTFQSEKPPLEPKQQKFSIKKQLYRGIKDNNASKIISRSNSRANEQSFQYDQASQIHHILTDKRKSYDDHKTATNTRKKQIQELKKEIRELTVVESSLRNDIQYSKTSLTEVVESLEDTKMQSEATTFQKEIYQNILERTKATLLVEKKRLFDLQLELSKLKGKHQSVETESVAKKKMEYQCRKMLNSVERLVSKEKRGRELKLASMQDVIVKKEDALRRRSERHREISFLAEQTANQKTSEEKEWSKLFYTHKFLHSILKNKISRELFAHEKVQKTFQRIKLSTGIIQSDELVRKYLSREETYGELLHSISEKEPLLERLQNSNERLSRQFKQLMEQEEFQKTISIKPTFVDNEYSEKERQLEKLSRKMLVFEKQKESFYQWAIKFLKKSDTITGQPIKDKLNYYDIYPRNQLDVLYKKVDFIISNILSETSKNPEQIKFKLLENRLDDTLDEDLFLKNMRIRTEGVQVESYHEEDDTEFYNEMEYLKEHRKNVIKEQRVKKFRIKTKAH